MKKEEVARKTLTECFALSTASMVMAEDFPNTGILKSYENRIKNMENMFRERLGRKNISFSVMNEVYGTNLNEDIFFNSWNNLTDSEKDEIKAKKVYEEMKGIYSEVMKKGCFSSSMEAGFLWIYPSGN